MKRTSFQHQGLTLSYLDSGGDGPLIVALHAMWMEARTFEDFANAMPEWRVVSLDQRGHGFSDHAADYTRAAFVGDIEALLDHLQVSQPFVLMGNSLGGTNAFCFAASHPGRVRGLVVEEGPPEEHGTFDFVLEWRGTYPTREALEQKIGDRLAWSVAPSFKETACGWTLRFDPTELTAMKLALNGDSWAEWLASTCPALVVRGTQSRAVDGAVVQAMADRRPNTRLLTLEAGHVTHHDAADAFNAVVREFVQSLSETVEPLAE